MRDFVFLHPTYLSSGSRRELTDLLVVLNARCIVISLKGTDGRIKTAERLAKWLGKRAFEASKNVKTAVQRLARVDITAENLWGEQKTFVAGSLKPECGIGLLECSQEMFRPVPFTSRTVTASVPIHVISVNDFCNLVVSLGSIWDLFHYLHRRSGVLQIFSGINQERPVLSYYTLRSHDLHGIIGEDKDKLSELHQLFLLEKLADYAERDRLLSYVNAVVHELHVRAPDMESFAPPELMHFVEPQDKRSAYLGMAALLNSLPASNKAHIGRKIHDCLKQAKSAKGGSCFAFKRYQENVVFVFACFSGFDRTERIRALANILPAAIWRYGLSEGLATAYDADRDDSGFDLLWLRGLQEFSSETKELGHRLFPDISTLHANPFGVAKSYAPSEPDC